MNYIDHKNKMDMLHRYSIISYQVIGMRLPVVSAAIYNKITQKFHFNKIYFFHFAKDLGTFR